MNLKIIGVLIIYDFKMFSLLYQHEMMNAETSILLSIYHHRLFKLLHLLYQCISNIKKHRYYWVMYLM